MLRRILKVPGLPFGGGLNVVLVAGAAYFVGEHGKGRHEQPHLLCPICWLDKVSPAPEGSGDARPSGDNDEPHG
ncbi:MAG TPA: hypothetical protein VGH27_05155 [Streptosporangiaceae bacterium]|jgi:hypothetical protein